MSKIDLHIHSAYSEDGEFSVRDIMERCRKEGVSCASITDHNTVRGVPEAIALGLRMSIRVISGVELDCVHLDKNLHLLGYHFDYSHPAFAEIEQDIRRQEKEAAVQKVERIGKVIKLPAGAEEVLGAAPDGIVTGERIAELLLKKEGAQEDEALQPYLPGGERADNPYVNFYWDYFSKGKPAYVPIRYISLSEAIALLHEAGGIAVLAHPGQSLRGENAMLEQLIKAGLDGIEAYSSYHSGIEAAYYDSIARYNKLLVTCGSDFHGKTKPSIPLCGHRAGDNMSAIAAAWESLL